MMNFDNFKYNKASLPTDVSERTKFLKQLKEEFIEEIKNSETASAYLANYSPLSIESFIKTYADRKVHLLEYYEYYSRLYHEKEESELHYYKQAEEMLQLILQKKLFNMQLRWRAGQLEIDEIDVAYGFQFWEKHISAATFIPPITIDELEMMKEYLMRFDKDDEDEALFMEWQDYDSITELNEYGDMDNMPDWYQFYDSRMGTGMLLLLPNLKGAKEDFYLDISRKATEQANPPANSTTTPLPYIHAYGADILNFSKHFEKDKYFSTLFKYYNYTEEKNHQSPNSEELNATVDFLLSADRPIYLKSHLTWDQALLVAAKDYRNTKVAEAIDFAYEEYLMMRDLGLYKDKSPEEIKKEYNKDYIIQIYREKILLGRTKNNEPGDFNY